MLKSICVPEDWNPSTDGDINLQGGCDESGRGSIIASVFAAAVILDPSKEVHPNLNDSKKLSRKQRAILRIWIEENSIWCVASRDNDCIDRINILRATQESMVEAFNGLSIKPTLLVVDGNYFCGIKGIPHVCVVGGDGIYANIAAASILAKEHHDDHIRNIHESLTEQLGEDIANAYNLLNCKGYGTAKHIAAIREHGVTSFHRRTFGKVAEYCRDTTDMKGVAVSDSKPKAPNFKIHSHDGHNGTAESPIKSVGKWTPFNIALC